MSQSMPFRHTILTMALISALLLTACGSSDNAALADQVAIAKDAADRAVKAQKAAERAASLARRQSVPARFGEDGVIEDVTGDDSTYSSGGEDSTDEAPSTIPR